MQEANKEPLLRYSFFKTFFFFFFLSASLGSLSSAQTDFSHEVPFQEAIPAFWTAVGDAVSGFSGQEEVAQWADDLISRRDEFLTDLVETARAMSEQPFLEADISPAEAFVEKWTAVLETCPQCREDLAPLVEPLVESLGAGLPAIPSDSRSGGPLSGLFVFFKEMEALNPWGVAAFFQLSPVLPSEWRLMIEEWARERTVNGIEDVTILSRLVKEVHNGKVIFEEQIINNEVVTVSFEADPRTLLHEALDRLIANGGDPDAIAFFSDILAAVDQKLDEACANGLLDAFTCAYLFDPRSIQNELIHVKHPLLKSPWNTQYKTAEFYPRNDFSGMGMGAAVVSLTAPAAENGRVLSAYGEIGEHFPPGTTSPSGQGNSAGGPMAEAAFSVWFLGVVVPVYMSMLWTVGRNLFF